MLVDFFPLRKSFNYLLYDHYFIKYISETLSLVVTWLEVPGQRNQGEKTCAPSGRGAFQHSQETIGIVYVLQYQQIYLHALFVRLREVQNLR